MKFNNRAKDHDWTEHYKHVVKAIMNNYNNDLIDEATKDRQLKEAEIYHNRNRSDQS